MPYVAIKCYPRPQEKLDDMVEKMNQLLMDAWGCPPETITISLEQIEPENWEEKVGAPEIEAKEDLMMILHGEKRF
ncbi:MAG: tautomerase family protein [Atopobiaceae bacterium]|nr:tautomerase family protein [Atopobiaceae bacterium]